MRRYSYFELLKIQPIVNNLRWSNKKVLLRNCKGQQISGYL